MTVAITGEQRVMTDREIDELIGQINELCARMGQTFEPDQDKLMAFRCAQRENEAMKAHFQSEMRRRSLGEAAP